LFNSKQLIYYYLNFICEYFYFCRTEIEGKQYMDQLMTRQNASLASENSSSGLIEEV